MGYSLRQAPRRDGEGHGGTIFNPLLGDME